MRFWKAARPSVLKKYLLQYNPNSWTQVEDKRPKLPAILKVQTGEGVFRLSGKFYVCKKKEKKKKNLHIILFKKWDRPQPNK